MINQDKPNVNIPETYLNIGDGFFLRVGSTFKLIVGALGLGGITNETKASVGETWGTIASTWASETQTWGEASQLITNAIASNTGALWSHKNAPWTNSTVWIANTITNLDKP